MRKRKTELDYRTELIEQHNITKEYPDNHILQKKLDAIVDRWANKLELLFFIAPNEGIPYTTEEVGYQCKTMPSKNVSGHYQTGDAVCYLPELECITNVCWERKGGEKPKKCIYKNKKRVFLDQTNYRAMDWYGTIMKKHDIKGENNEVIHEDNIDRFVRECHRAKNEGFDMLIVGVESTVEQFLAYRPYGGHGANTLSRLRRSESIIQKTCGFAHILYCGTRKNAIETMISQNRLWIKNNYTKILRLEI